MPRKPESRRPIEKKPARAAKAKKSVPPSATKLVTKKSASSSPAKLKASKTALKGSKTQSGVRSPTSRKKKPDAEYLSALVERLTRAVPRPECELHFKTPFELLIATILAAQSTDKMINLVMPELLAALPDVRALAAAPQEQVEQLVLRSGFFRNKAKAIRGTAQALVERHGGEVPRSLDELVQLPGVARKTANVVLGTAYRIAAGFVVDTHVNRVSQRLGLTTQSDPVLIEQDLCRLFARETWIDLGHRFTLHGRYTCLAKTPLCESCPLSDLCPSRQADAAGEWTEHAEREAARIQANAQFL
jgi:endonuclease-3